MFSETQACGTIRATSQPPSGPRKDGGVLYVANSNGLTTPGAHGTSFDSDGVTLVKIGNPVLRCNAQPSNLGQTMTILSNFVDTMV